MSADGSTYGMTTQTFWPFWPTVRVSSGRSRARIGAATHDDRARQVARCRGASITSRCIGDQSDLAAASLQGTLAELARMIQVGVVEGPAKRWKESLVAQLLRSLT